MPISAMELLISNLERRALALGKNSTHPRICDLHMLLPAITGKVELVYEGEQKGVEMVARQIIGEAVKNLFDRRFPKVEKAVGSGGEEDQGPYSEIVRWFAEGNEVILSDEMSFDEYWRQLDQVPGLVSLASSYGATRQDQALAAEIILEGLHQHLKLGRQDLDSQITYKEMIKFHLLKPHRQERENW
jgi:magnesium chelatase subunit I